MIVLNWCFDVVKGIGLKFGDYMGGFVINDMKIQVIF